MKTLFVAAGGGGDTVGVLLARRLLAEGEDGPLLVATCAWERLIVDPVPGPRSPSGFSGLGPNGEVLATSETVPPGRSMLPRIAEESDARIFLLDLVDGVVGLTRQLGTLCRSLKVDRLVVVDTGGDAVATGKEPGLLSPLCDAMSVAAGLCSGVPTLLAVVGPGTDAELSEADVLGRLAELGSEKLGSLNDLDVEPLRDLLTWHPTEASGLVAAAALGARLRVAMRRGGSPRATTDHSAEVWLVRPALAQLPLALLVSDTATLAEAAELVAQVAPNELAYEVEKAASLGFGQGVAPNPRGLEEDLGNGATHVTLRRARELTGLDRPVGQFGHIRVSQTEVVLLSLSAT